MKPRHLSLFSLGLLLLASLLIVPAEAAKDKKEKVVPPCEIALGQLEMLDLPALHRFRRGYFRERNLLEYFVGEARLESFRQTRGRQ